MSRTLYALAATLSFWPLLQWSQGVRVLAVVLLLFFGFAAEMAGEFRRQLTEV